MLSDTDRGFPCKRVLEFSDVGGFHPDRAITFKKFIDSDRVGCSHGDTHHLPHLHKTPVFCNSQRGNTSIGYSTSDLQTTPSSYLTTPNANLRQFLLFILELRPRKDMLIILDNAIYDHCIKILGFA